jgi:hypothetical protein
VVSAAADDRVRVLTVRQPWAWAIVTGLKDVENRSWRLRWPHPLLVHASLRDDPAGWEFLDVHGIAAPNPCGISRGKIVGAMAVGAVTSGPHPSFWAFPRLYHWSITAAVAAERPLAAAGRTGLWPAPTGWQAAFDGPRQEAVVAALGGRPQDARLF